MWRKRNTGFGAKDDLAYNTCMFNKTLKESKMTSIKIYIDRHAYVHVPVDQHWIQIAQTVRDRYAEWNRDFPEDQVSISERDRNSPWNLHWNDMMEPRYYAHECVGEILGKNVPFDFDACNDYQDLEDDLEALLVELEEEVAE